jgi:hypothetical protein
MRRGCAKSTKDPFNIFQAMIKLDLPPSRPKKFSARLSSSFRDRADSKLQKEYMYRDIVSCLDLSEKP